MSGTTGFDLAEGIEVLERTPKVLDAMLEGLSDAWVHVTEGGESWSPARIVAHLIQGESTDWIPRARIIMELGEARPFDPFHETARDGSLPELLEEFRTLRARSLAELRSMNLSEDDLRRTGRHPSLGRVTLEQLLACWVVHDLGHIRQIARVMAKRYRNEVGPWEAYLPVVHE